MIDIQCDHVNGWRWPFIWQCKSKASKHLLHHPKWGHGDDPQVLLLCAKHHSVHIALAVKVTVRAHVEGHPLQLSHVVKDTGDI